MRTISDCRSCHSTDLVEVLDLGEQYLADFRPDDVKPPKYPLTLLLCNECTLVQLKHTTPSSEMYHERYGFKSGINEAIKADLKSNVKTALAWNPNPSKWLDIASNDGTLLSYVPSGVHRVGVDPITKHCEEAIREGRAEEILND